MEPHVFVVMPFNVKEVQPKTDADADADAPAKPAVNVDFNEVYKLLIAPALTKAGCVPFRADQEAGAGDIRTDMYFELVTADVIVADISILNANVFYELGMRHGVAPRGVLMIHGGWSTRPFDVAPDRTFDYDGKLFVTPEEQRDETWRKSLAAAVETLATMFRNALAVDGQTISSPVYEELVGLKPADWRGIQTARAKYFGQLAVDWKTRIEVAKANGWPGDIMTLAGDAPTRFHRGKLLWEAASALIGMHRFDVALMVLDELLVAVAPVRAVLEQRAKVLEQKSGGIKNSEPCFKKVLVFSGHMIDKPDRPAPRFPSSKEAAVRERLAHQLRVTGVGAGDLAICGGARGGDILFAELCAESGAEVWIFRALPEAEFLEASVRLPGGDWEARYFALRDREGVKVFDQHDRLGSPPKGASVYARNNLWMLNTARVEADDPKNLHALLVWDEQPTGDGTGGTSDFAARVKKIGGRLAPVVNPTTL